MWVCMSRRAKLVSELPLGVWLEALDGVADGVCGDEEVGGGCGDCCLGGVGRDERVVHDGLVVADVGLEVDEILAEVVDEDDFVDEDLEECLDDDLNDDLNEDVDDDLNEDVNNDLDGEDMLDIRDPV
ncbi:MAG: hypothetical protein Q9182_002545 [Xanthomendoza sp. 2 TL-2023]